LLSPIMEMYKKYSSDSSLNSDYNTNLYAFMCITLTDEDYGKKLLLEARASKDKTLKSFADAVDRINKRKEMVAEEKKYNDIWDKMNIDFSKMTEDQIKETVEKYLSDEIFLNRYFFLRSIAKQKKYLGKEYAKNKVLFSILKNFYYKEKDMQIKGMILGMVQEVCINDKEKLDFFVEALREENNSNHTHLKEDIQYYIAELAYILDSMD
jgi:hypothetical protein